MLEKWQRTSGTQRGRVLTRQVNRTSHGSRDIHMTATLLVAADAERLPSPGTYCVGARDDDQNNKIVRL